MKISAAHKPTVAITPNAASVLAQLRSVYEQNLKFRVFAGGFDAPALRVHDRDYDGDILMDASGTGIALCPITYHTVKSIHIDCRAVPDPQHGFEMLLHINHRLTTLLSGGQIIERVLAPAPDVNDLNAYTEEPITNLVF